MSNYASVDFSNNSDVNTIFSNKKNKFIEKKDPSQDIPGHYFLSETKTHNIDIETNLINPGINSKEKLQVKLNDILDPNIYSVNYFNDINEDTSTNINFYYTNKDGGAGRGFGNLNISNDIRNGNDTRKYTKEYKEKQESEQLFDYQFQYLNKNFQDPSHLVMPIPRGGNTTRKQNQLSVNTMRHMNENNDLLKTIKFQY